MKLIEAHIKNFGKLENVDFSFDENYTAILRNNGWGKTTFASFICAMFFGMEESRKQGLNDRKKYMPFGRDLMAGSVLFEENGKRLLLERTFRKKESEDTFLLKDAVTGLACQDYSLNIGQELFHVDRDTFRRTLFIMQGDLEVESTSGIMSGIGDGGLNVNDLDELEKAYTLLENRKKEYSSNKGELSLAKKQKREINDLIKTKPHVLRNISDKKDQIGELAEAIRDKKAQIDEVAAAIAKQSIKEEKLGIYKSKKEQVSVIDAKLHPLERLFAGEEVSVNQINELIDKSQTAHSIEQKIAALQDKKDNLSQNTEMLNEFEELNDLFGGNVPTDDEFARIKDVNANIISLRDDKQKKSEERNKLMYLLEAEETKQAPHLIGKPVYVLLVIAAAVFAVMSLISIFAQAGFGMAVLFALLMVCSLVLLFAQITKGNNAKQDYDTLIAKKDEIKAKIDENELTIAAIAEELEHSEDEGRNFVEKYGMTFDVNLGGKIELLESKARSFVRYKKAIGEREAALKQVAAEICLLQPELDSLLNEIKCFLKTYEDRGLEGKTAEDMLYLLKNQLISFQNNLAEKDGLVADINAFEADNDINEVTLSVRELDAQKNEYVDERDSLIRNMDKEQKDLADIVAELEKIEDAEGEIIRVTDHIDELVKQKEEIELAQSFMTQARLNFLAGYIGPLKKALQDNMSEIAGDEAVNLNLDVSLNLTYDTSENAKELGYLSTGMKDLVYICERFALANVMFGDKPPFMVLDDPFTNLDEEKNQKAIEMIKRFSDNCQVVYFTCHGSRI